MSRALHMQGAYLYRSRLSGLKVHTALCGAGDSLSVAVLPRAAIVTCKRCLKCMPSHQATGAKA